MAIEDLLLKLKNARPGRGCPEASNLKQSSARVISYCVRLRKEYEIQTESVYKAEKKGVRIIF